MYMTVYGHRLKIAVVIVVLYVLCALAQYLDDRLVLGHAASCPYRYLYDVYQKVVFGSTVSFSVQSGGLPGYDPMQPGYPISVVSFYMQIGVISRYHLIY